MELATSICWPNCALEQS